MTIWALGEIVPADWELSVISEPGGQTVPVEQKWACGYYRLPNRRQTYTTLHALIANVAVSEAVDPNSGASSIRTHSTTKEELIQRKDLQHGVDLMTA